MSDKYKMRENEKAYFVTLKVIDWLDVFTQLARVCDACQLTARF
jgi:hypothetical protein